MSAASVILLCALAIATAAPDGISKEPRPDFTMDPRIPHFKLPAFVPRKTLSCSKKLLKTTLAPGESATFQSPNYPSIYDSKSTCKWRFTSTTNIKIECTDFLLQPANKKGKCSDKLTLDGTKFCGNSLSSYSGDKSINVLFKSNKKSNYGGFSCTASAEPGTTVTSAPVTTSPGTCKCGQAKRATRIVGGVVTEVLEYPWQAAMVYSGSTSVFCGASVITSKHVLTAAHCTQAVKDYGFTYQVMVGAHSLTTAAKSQQILGAWEYIQHPSYSSSTYDNDISIIVLTKTIDFTSTEIRPVCLPTSASNDYASVTATVSGWGRLKYQGSQPDVLMEVDVPTMTNTKCKTYYNDGSITDNMICAGFQAGGKDSCQGDSGGPLIYKSGSSYVQIGVVSWGSGCAWANYPGVYARVTKYLSWISSNSASSTTCSAA